MSEAVNPYTPPTGGADNPGKLPATDPTGAITPEVMNSLRGTRPWVIFLAILGFLFAALMGFAGLAMMASDGFGGSLPATFGLIYILLAVFYLFPSIYLIRYGGAIGTLLGGGGVPALERALGQQRSFWRLVGIMAVLVIGLYVLGILLVVVVGVSGLR